MNPVAQTWTTKTNVRLRRTAQRMREGARAGSAAIEFALIAPIFFVLLMGTMEVGIMFFAQFTLQNAVMSAARMIRTGQVATANMTAAQFRTSICNNISPILACDGNLQIDVESYANFSSVNFANPLTASNTLDPSLNNFSTGNVCSVVLVRAFYTWSVVTPLLTPFMVNMANNEHLLTATAAFRNEPYNTSVAGC
ncbi:MAG: pilus assembly protein [Alphaproteobacteria bacterium]|nr:pilus assembly protein [Alphaproteobacteria bacterium]